MVHRKKRAPSGCSSATPYIHPEASETVTAYSNYTLTWTPACLDAKQIDIYLYHAATTATAPLHVWTNVQTSSGSLQTIFNVNWWNATQAETAELYLQIVDSTDPAWASSYSVGPTFNVAWDGTIPADMTPTPPSSNTTVEAQSSIDSGAKGVVGGKLVAAVLIPLLVVAAIGAAYILWNRRKSKSATKRWSKVVEKRMSQISAAGEEWRPPVPRPGSLAASYISAAHHRSSGSLGSQSDFNFALANNDNRASRISFATTSPQSSPAKNRLPRVGQQSGLRGHHCHQASVSSSLRHEFRGSHAAAMFSEADLAGAVSYIQADDSLEQVSHTGSHSKQPSFETSGGYLSTSASIGSHEKFQAHSRKPSELSMKMPRLKRSSLSPDQALLAYSQAKDKQELPVTTKPPSTFGMAM